MIVAEVVINKMINWWAAYNNWWKINNEEDFYDNDYFEDDYNEGLETFPQEHL